MALSQDLYRLILCSKLEQWLIETGIEKLPEETAVDDNGVWNVGEFEQTIMGPLCIIVPVSSAAYIPGRVIIQFTNTKLPFWWGL